MRSLVVSFLKRFRPPVSDQEAEQAARDAIRRFPTVRQAKPSGLPSPLTVSLTSFAARFGELHLTIKSLLDQTIKADQVVLWLSSEDAAKAPQSLRDLESVGLTIRTTPDKGPYTKLLPSLSAYPEHYIATADDDLYYPPNWLERLVAAVEPGDRTIVVHRVHRIRFASDGSLLPYDQWHRNVDDAASQQPSDDLMLTGVLGVLYPPGSLSQEATDYSLASRLSLKNDDLWFFFMARAAGTKIKRVPGPGIRQITWRGTQDVGLWQDGTSGRNDTYMQALSAHFGTITPTDADGRASSRR